MPRSCLFCGGMPVTREHVIPRWTYAELGVFGPITKFVAEREIRQTPKPTLDIVVRAVCAACNGGWLSDLEVKTRAVLGPAMTGAETLIPASAQETIATWAVKTALLMEVAEASIRGKAYAPPSQFVALHRERRPPPDTHVWLGAVDAKGHDIAWSKAVAIGNGPKPDGYMATVAIGYVVLHVVGWDLPAARVGPIDEPVVPGRFVPMLDQLWPPTSIDVAWPRKPWFGSHRDLNDLFVV